ILAGVFLEFGGKPVVRGDPVQVARTLEDEGHVGIAKPRGGFDQRIEHWSQIESGATDYLENVCGSGLLLQRLCEIVGTTLQLVEQAHVLNRDRSLVRKRLDERDLFLGERPDSLQMIDHHDAEQFIALQDGNSKNGPDVLGVLRPISVSWVGAYVVN